VEGTPQPHHSRLSAIRREGERVTPLELFFDLVFVLAITQCTALMSHDQTWSGLAQGLLILGVLALYLLGLVAFRYRHVHTLNRHRLGLAIVLLCLIPVATAVPALVSVAVADTLIWAMIVFEHRGYGTRRTELRREASAARS
jgi:low temperature requirement protein LtrA